MRRPTINQSISRSSINPVNSSRLSISTIEEPRRRDRAVLRDKQTMATSSSILESFLLSNKYSGRIGNVTANTGPSAKEVQGIFIFILSFIDKSFCLTNKFEEDGINILKLLKYPYISEINKSQLLASTPQTWPIILSMLHWLVDLAEFLKSTNEKLDNKKNETDMINSMFYDFVCSGYKRFLNNEDDKTLEEDFLKNVANLSDKKYSSMEARINDLKKIEDQISQLETESKMSYEDFSKSENSKVDFSVNESKNTESSIFDKKNHKKMTKKQYLAEKLRDLEREDKKIEEKVKKYNIKINSLVTIIEKSKKETDEQKKENDLSIKTINTLKDQISKQAIKPQQLNEINTEKTILFNELEKIKPMNESKTIEIKEEEREKNSRVETIEKLLVDLKNVLNEELPLKIVREMKDGCENFKFVGDIVEQRKKLEDKINENQHNINELDEEINNLEVKSEDLNEELEETKERNIYSEKELIRISRYYLQQKDQFDQNKKIIISELESLNETILKDKNERSTEIFILENEIEKTKIKIDGMKKNYEYERDQIIKIAYELKYQLEKMKNDAESEINNLDFTNK